MNGKQSPEIETAIESCHEEPSRRGRAPICPERVGVHQDRGGDPPCSERAVEEFRQWLVPYVRAWARHNIHFGVSRWASPGEDGRFFATACVRVNALHPGEPSSLLRMKRQLPDGFGLTVEVSNDAMIFRFPHSHPEAAKRGMINDRFLDAGLMQEQLFQVVQLIEPHVRAVLLQISRIYPTENFSFEAFLDRLDRCLTALPPVYRYAVEIHNPEFLLPDYFACLHTHNVAHVLHQCVTNRDRPSLVDQSQTPDILTTDFAVLRVLAECDTMPAFPPGALGETDHEVRLGVLQIVRRCLDERRTLYLYLSDSAPRSIAAIMDMLNPDLAKLSPLKKRCGGEISIDNAYADDCSCSL
jgi:hypothetical protein